MLKSQIKVNLTLTILTHSAHWVASVSISSCGTRLVSGSWDGGVVLWNCETWTPILNLDIAARGKKNLDESDLLSI